MAENEVEQETPEYHIDDFRAVAPIAILMESRGAREGQWLDPDGKIAPHLANRRDLLTRAWRIENRILAQLSPGMLKELFHSGDLINAIRSMDRRLGRMNDRGQGQSDDATGLYVALKTARVFAINHGYEPEQIGKLFGLELFEQMLERSKRAAADQPHGGA